MRVNKLQIGSRVVRYDPPMIAGDLVIDGTSLHDHVLKATKHDYGLCTPLSWMPAQYLRDWRMRLLAVQPGLLPAGRCELLICPLCGDLGCGCVSCSVSQEGDYIVWAELGWEESFASDELTRFSMGSFRFHVDELARALGLDDSGWKRAAQLV